MLQNIGKVLGDAQAMSAKRPGRFAKLFKPRPNEYQVRPDVHREMSLVDGGLRKLFMGLITGRKPWPLYLHGEVGTGKTRAAFCFCDHVRFGRYWTVADVMNLMVIRDPPWTTSWGWDETPQLAVLDELGTHALGEDARSYFEYDAVKQFLDWREDRPAVYVSNHPLKMMEELYDERIKSRLGVGTVYELKGPDRREAGRLPGKPERET